MSGLDRLRCVLNSLKQDTGSELNHDLNWRPVPQYGGLDQGLLGVLHSSLDLKAGPVVVGCSEVQASVLQHHCTLDRGRERREGQLNAGNNTGLYYGTMAFLIGASIHQGLHQEPLTQVKENLFKVDKPPERGMGYPDVDEIFIIPVRHFV